VCPNGARLGAGAEGDICSLAAPGLRRPSPAQSVTGLYKTAMIRHAGTWRGLESVELATLDWGWGATNAGS